MIKRDIRGVVRVSNPLDSLRFDIIILALTRTQDLFRELAMLPIPMESLLPHGQDTVLR